MTIRNLDRLLAPRSVALIGARVTPESVGLKVAENLVAGGFDGPVQFVNRRHAEVLGRRCFATVAELPEPPDLADPTLRLARLELERVPSASASS